jgi:hypothetical protein
MAFTSKGVHEVLVAGCQETMYKIDVDKGVITSTVCLNLVCPIDVTDQTIAQSRCAVYNDEAWWTIHLCWYS